MYKKLIWSSLGVYAAYLTASVLSQRIYSGYQYPQKSNPHSRDLFRYPSLVFSLSCLLCALYGMVKSAYLREKQSQINLKDKLTLGLLYCSNALTTNYSLLFISYPTQTIGRNLKYLAVLVVGSYFSRVPQSGTEKNHSLSISSHKIFIGLTITVGVVMFNGVKFLNQDVLQSKESGPQVHVGYLLLMVSVLCDAFFNDTQAFVKFKYSPSSNEMYTWANWYGFVFSALFSIFSGTLMESIRFVVEHDEILRDIFLMCLLQLLGQNCIYLIVSEFKQHIFPLISTTRKMLTVLISIYIYQHPINLIQWLSIFLVFGSMIYEIRDEANEQGRQKISEGSERRSLNGYEESSEGKQGNTKKQQEKDQ